MSAARHPWPPVSRRPTKTSATACECEPPHADPSHTHDGPLVPRDRGSKTSRSGTTILRANSWPHTVIVLTAPSGKFSQYPSQHHARQADGIRQNDQEVTSLNSHGTPGMQEVAEIPHEQCRDVTTAPRQDHRHARRFPDERKANDDQSYDKRNTSEHYLSQNAGSI